MIRTQRLLDLCRSGAPGLRPCARAGRGPGAAHGADPDARAGDAGGRAKPRDVRPAGPARRRGAARSSRAPASSAAGAGASREAAGARSAARACPGRRADSVASSDPGAAPQAQAQAAAERQAEAKAETQTGEEARAQAKADPAAGASPGAPGARCAYQAGAISAQIRGIGQAGSGDRTSDQGSRQPGCRLRRRRLARRPGECGARLSGRAPARHRPSAAIPGGGASATGHRGGNSGLRGSGRRADRTSAGSQLIRRPGPGPGGSPGT